MKLAAPSLLVVAMAPSLDRETRRTLIEAGAAAVFERHADLVAYRAEVAALLDFWTRLQSPTRFGT